MLGKIWFVALAVLGLAAFEVEMCFSRGPRCEGVPHASAGAPAADAAGCGNSGLISASRKRLLRSPWAYGNACGWGWRLRLSAWGYGYAGLADVELEGVPYFAQFPPVYYGYGDNMPVLKSPIRSAWAGSESAQPAAAAAASASPAASPLRIVNPYYVEARRTSR